MIRVWVADGEGVREVPATECGSYVVQPSVKMWIDLDNEDEAVARSVLAPFGIHPLVLADMVGEVNRPKVDAYGNYLYIVVHSARWDADRPTLREIDVVLGERFLITYHDGSTRSIAAAHAVLPQRPALLATGPGTLLHFILDVLIDHYLPIMDRIADEIDGLEEQLFDSEDTLSHLRIIRLKRGMSALRRIVGPQRDTMLALTRDEFRPIPAELRPYLRDVYDRLARVNDLLDSFRDEVATLLELHVTMVSNRLNDVIKRLTVIATIGLPLTVITSYYGMNFEFHEYRFGQPTLYVLGLLLASAAITWWFLKRNRSL